MSDKIQSTKNHHHSRIDALKALQEGRYNDAIHLLNRTLRDKSDDWISLFNLAFAHYKLGQESIAAQYIDRYLIHEPSDTTAWNLKGELHIAQRDFLSALESFNRALKFESDNHGALKGASFAYLRLGQKHSALETLETLLMLSPSNPVARNNAGSLALELGQLEKARQHLEQAVLDEPSYGLAWLNLGLVYRSMGEMQAAKDCFKLARERAADLPFLLGEALHTSLRMGGWENFEVDARRAAEEIDRGHLASSPFSMQSFSDSPVLLQRCSQMFWSHYYQYVGEEPLAFPASLDNKIKVVYLSPDFANHPVAHALENLLRSHTRTKFHVSALYWGAGRAASDYDRVRASVDEFICIDDMQDGEVVNICRESGFHIAIDLAGSTQSARTALFARRLAPIQISWLGFLGTMGHKTYDYLIADPVVIPQHLQQFYDENLILLPCFQTNMHVGSECYREVSAHGTNASERTKIVFGCFNNGYKINPLCFGMWARILEAVPDSELWLNDESESFRCNVTREAIRYGLSADRIQFRPRLPIREYHHRYHKVDVALDTFPYNGGVTSTDALSRGVPLVSLFGQSFQSRMGRSFLSQLGLEDLSCSKQEDYVKRAILLGSEAKVRMEIRRSLKNSLPGSFLFDPFAFRDCLEAALEEAVDLYRAGRAPATMLVTKGRCVELQADLPLCPQRQ